MKNLSKVFLLSFIFLFAVAGQMMGQQKTITGQVTDASNEGMPGVSVQLKGTTNGTITNIDGKYSISVPNTKAVLVFSFVGYSTQEQSVGNQTKVNVLLKEDTQNLDEVVVVAYGTAKRSDLTGSIGTMRPDANDAAKSASIDGLLQGKIAGLNVSSSSSAAGAASSIIIRGANSLRGDNQPLYVIDNIPQASTGEFPQSALGGQNDFQIAQDPLSSLNPNDIEDITVLKDASATAIYGSRGANGVILITTKKGKEGKARVNVSANFEIASPEHLYNMMNVESYAKYMNSKTTTPSYFFSGNEVHYVWENLDKYDPNNPETYQLLQYKNWQKELYRSALSQNYSVSVNGGNKGMTYYISANFKDIEGIAQNTGVKQGDLRANISAELSRSVKLNLNMSGSLRENTMMSGGDSRGGISGAASRTALDAQPFIRKENDPAVQSAEYTTVDAWIKDYSDLSHDKSFKVSLDLGWKITSFLTYNLRGGGNISINDRGRWYGESLFAGKNDNGLLLLTDWNRSNYNVENVFNLNTKLGKIGTLGATLGMTYDDYGSLTKNIKATNFPNKDLGINGLANAVNPNFLAPVQKDYQLLSYLGRVNLNFQEKYLVTASLRVDGSSKFMTGNRYSYFPSASLAWRVDQEKFMKPLECLSQLKLRVSYGVTGSQSIDPYSTISDYDRLIDYASAAGEKELAVAINRLQNEGLKWERTSSWNAGIDFGFFNQRISGSIDLYAKKTNDLLIKRELPPSSGFGSVTLNQGSLTNKGIEAMINVDVIKGKIWSWTVGGNVALNKARIGNLGMPVTDFSDQLKGRGYNGNSLGDLFGVANIFMEGYAPGLFIGYKTDGIVQEADLTNGSYTVKSDLSKKPPVAGDVKLVDQNGDDEINQKDLVIIGDPNRDVTYGFQTKLTYKNIYLSASFIGVGGNDILNTNIRYIGTPSNKAGNLTQQAFDNMWTTENPGNLLPGSNYNMPNGFIYDRYIESGSYLRCSDITLNYTLPTKWMRKIGFRNTSVFASVKNAFTITGYSGYNPEVNSFAFDGLRPGIDMSAFPNVRSFIFGLSLNF